MPRIKKKKPERYDDPFPKRLRKILELKKISQKNLAEKLGVSPSTVNAYYDGSTMPDIITLYKLSNILGVSSDYLIGLTNERTRTPDLQKSIKYTGLSESALINIHHLGKKNDISANLGFQEALNSLDFILREKNQGMLLSMLQNITDCRACISKYNKDKEIEAWKAENKMNAEAQGEGIVYLTPDKAARFHAQEAARYLIRICLQGIDEKGGDPDGRNTQSRKRKLEGNDQ